MHPNTHNSKCPYTRSMRKLSLTARVYALCNMIWAAEVVAGRVSLASEKLNRLELSTATEKRFTSFY